MATCASCGAAGAGRFCSHCGEALSSTAGGPRIIGAGASTPARTGTTRGSRRRTILLTAVAIIIIGVVGGSVVSAVGGGRDTASRDEGPRATTAPERLDPPPTADPDGGNAPQTTEPAPVSTAGDTDHWLGEQAGWYVLVRSLEGLKRVDLDTGEVVSMGPDLFPLAFTGEYVVLQNQFGELTALRPSALTGPPFTAAISPTTTEQYTRRSRFTVSDDPGRVWIDPIDGPLAGVEVDLETGRELRRASEDDLGRRSWSLSSAQFTSPLSGGIYRLGDDSVYRRVRDGAVVAEGYGRMLITECSDRLECRYRWLDATTLQPLPDLAVPGALVPLIPLVMANGRVISDGGSGFIDIETGERFTVLAEEISGLIDGWAQLSPDSRFIASVSRGSLTVRSLGTSVGQQPELRTPSRATPVFMPKPATVKSDAR